MNNAHTIAVARGFQVVVLCLMVGALLGCASANPELGSNRSGKATPATTNSQEMVDCLLPGQIRQLEETVTYLTERRLVRATKGDCTDRGGVVQPSEGSTEAPAHSGK